MSKKIKILSPIVIILLFVIIFIFYQKSNDDDKYDTSDLLAKQETLNQDEITELASKTLILCANNFDTNKTKAIKTEKIGENVYYLTYDSSKKADHALDKYSKDENIIYCEKDTAIQTSEVDDTPSIQEAIINQHKNSETGDIYNNIDVNEDENKIDRNKATIVVIDSGANGTYKNAYNAFNGSSDVTDTVGHGTKMIETIKENISEENYEIVPIKIANDNGYATVSSLIKALNYAVKLNPTIVNISLTSTNKGSAEILNQYITKLGDNGTAVVVSAGNNHDNVANYVPANSSNAITVGSCDTTGKIKTFSNYGEGINWLVTSDSTSEAAAITSGLYASAFLKNESPLKILKESGKVFDYKQDTLENLDNLTIDDEAVWWCGGTYSDSGALGGVGTVYTTHRSITTWNVVYDDKKHGSETWPSGVTISIINHKKDHHPYYIHNGHTYVALSNDGPRNTNGNNQYIRSYGWFEISEVTNAVGYTVSYNANGGTGTMPTDTAIYGQNYTTRSNAFTRSGYTFVGWNEKADGTGVNWTNYIGKSWKWQYNKNITLYAQWKANTYTNTISHWMWGFKNKEGNNSDVKTAYFMNKTIFNSEYGSQALFNQDKAIEIPNGFDLDKTFYNNTYGTHYTLPTSFTSKSNIAVEYHYRAKNYNITYNLNGGTNNTSNPTSYNVMYGVSLKNPTKDDSKFLGWTCDTDLGAKYDSIQYTRKKDNIVFINDTSTSGNRYNLFKIQLYTENGTSYLDSIGTSTTLGSNRFSYKHNRASGYYAIRAAANGNKQDQEYWLSKKIWLQKGQTYEFYFDLNTCNAYEIQVKNLYFKQALTFENVTSSNLFTKAKFQIMQDGKVIAQPITTDKLGTHTVLYTHTGSSGGYTVRIGANGTTEDAVATYDNIYFANGYTYTISFNLTEMSSKKITIKDLKVKECYHYTATNGNQFTNMQVNVYNGSTSIKEIIKTAEVGSHTINYTHTAASGYYMTKIKINGTGSQTSGNWSNYPKIYFEKGKTYKFSFDLNKMTASQVNIDNFKLVETSYITGINEGKTASALATENYLAEAATRQTGDITLTAQWSANSYTNTLKYDANGGTGAPTNQIASVTYPNTASTFTVSTTKPSRTGYTFTGWYTAATGGTKVETTYTVGKDNQAKNQSATLYAQWKANKYTNTLKYDANGGTGAPANQTASVTYPNTASTFTVSTTKPSRTGYTFTGWYTAATGGTKVETTYTVGKDNQAKNQNATLYAQWKANKYTNTLKYDSNGGTGAPANQTASVTYPNTASTFTVSTTKPSRTGYTFTGWYTAATGGTKVETTYTVGKDNQAKNQNATLYAQWKANKYTNTLKYDANGGTGAPANQTASVTYPNTASTFTVSTTKPSRTGYTFAGWYTAATGGTKVETTYTVGSNNQAKNQSATLYAYWKANVYTVTLQPSGGSLNVEDGSITKNSNGSATFEVTYDTTNYYNLGITASKTGYQVNGFYNNTSGGKKLWNNGGACLNDGTYWLNNKWHYAGDVTLYVQWTANTYTIKYDGNGATGGSTASSNHTYDSAKTLTPNGFVKIGYTFNGWNTQSNGKGTSYPDKAYVKNLTAVNNSTVTLYAQWKANTYTVTYNSNKPTNASTTISGTMQTDTATYDQNYTTRANGYTLPGYTFVGWNEKADGTGTDWTGYINKPWRWTYTKNVTLYAQWKANTYTVTYDSNKPANASTTISGTMPTDTATFDQNYITRENGFKLPGYTFVGWNEKKDGTGTDWTGYINKPWRWTYTKNVTLYAQWKANTYTIKLDGNGNTSGTMSNINATFDKEIKLPNSTFRKTEYHFIGWSTTKNGEVKYKDGATIKNLTPEQGKTITLYAVWKELPKAKGVDIAIIKDDGVKMINNNTLESFVNTELQLTIADNKDNITLQSYKILNLDEIKNQINNTESQSEIEIKVEVTYSTGDKSYKVINKDGNPCKLKVLTLVLGDSAQTYTRYIEDDGTLNTNSSWTTNTNKKTLLEEALNKNLDEIPSKDITK